MAIEFIGAGTIGSIANGKTITPTFHASTTTGDIVFALVCHYNDTTAPSSLPSGWSQIGSTQTFGTTSGYSLYYKVVEAGEDTTPTWTWEANHKLLGQVFTYRGQAESDFIHDYSDSEYQTADQYVRAAGISTTIATTLIFFSGIFFSSQKWTGPPTTPGTFTERYDNGDTTGDHWLHCSDYAWASTGAAGNIDGTLYSDSGHTTPLTTQTNKAAFAVALKAISGVTTTISAGVAHAGGTSLTPSGVKSPTVTADEGVAYAIGISLGASQSTPGGSFSLRDDEVSYGSYTYRVMASSGGETSGWVLSNTIGLVDINDGIARAEGTASTASGVITPAAITVNSGVAFGIGVALTASGTKDISVTIYAGAAYADGVEITITASSVADDSATITEGVAYAIGIMTSGTGIRSPTVSVLAAAAYADGIAVSVTSTQSDTATVASGIAAAGGVALSANGGAVSDSATITEGVAYAGGTSLSALPGYSLSYRDDEVSYGSYTYRVRAATGGEYSEYVESNTIGLVDIGEGIATADGVALSANGGETSDSATISSGIAIAIGVALSADGTEVIEWPIVLNAGAVISAGVAYAGGTSISVSTTGDASATITSGGAVAAGTVTTATGVQSPTTTISAGNAVGAGTEVTVTLVQDASTTVSAGIAFALGVSSSITSGVSIAITSGGAAGLGVSLTATGVQSPTTVIAAGIAIAAGTTITPTSSAYHGTAVITGDGAVAGGFGMTPYAISWFERDKPAATWLEKSKPSATWKLCDLDWVQELLFQDDMIGDVPSDTSWTTRI